MNGYIERIVRRAALNAAFIAFGTLYMVGTASAVTAVTDQFGAAKDTMIFQNPANNGAGGAPGFFSGSNNSTSPRRSLIEFDVSSIPSNAVITDVQLRLVIGQIAGSTVIFPDPTIGLHKLLVDWGEANTGASTATNINGIGSGSAAQSGDATWNA